MSDTIATLINHDINKVNYCDFIIRNLQLIIFMSSAEFARGNLFSLYYINVYSTNSEDTDDKLDLAYENIKKKIQHYCGSYGRFDMPNVSAPEVQRIRAEHYEETKNLFLNKSMKILEFSSDVLLSREFFFHCYKQNLFNQPIDIVVPLMHYKYEYIDAHHAGKTYKVKNYIKSSVSYFQGKDKDHQYIPDWDERLYINHSIMEKMSGAIPTAQPSSLLHNWPQYIKIIFGKANQDLFIPNHKFVVHRFENVGEL